MKLGTEERGDTDAAQKETDRGHRCSRLEEGEGGGAGNGCLSMKGDHSLPLF